MVSSSWLAALCKQLLCLKVIARYLGSGYGFKLGRQATWRPGCHRNGVVRAAPAVDQWMGVTWCTFGTVLCDEEPQRRTVGEIVFQRLDPFKIKGKVISVGSFCRGTSFGRVTSASMSTAVTHRLDFLHVEADGARWHTPRGALLKSATRRRRSSATVPSTTCTPIPRSLICSRQLDARRGHRHNTDQSGPSIALNTQWLVGGSGGLVATVAYGASCRLCLCGRDHDGQCG